MSGQGLRTGAVDDTNDDWLHAEGDKLYDMYGNEVWLTGANWFGMNCSECFLHGLWSCDMSDTLASIADHGINLLRIPVSTELLYYWMIGEPDPASGINAKNTPDYSFNPELCREDGTQMDSLEIFDVLLKLCKENGIKVMVDVHSPDANNSGHNYELWYGKEMSTGVMVTTEIWMDTWVWLADRYKNDDTLIALDLKNEPHGKRGYDSATCPTTIAKWDNSTDENNWKYAAETCAKKILEVNPNVLIVVEGIEQYPKTEQGYNFDTPDVWEPTVNRPSPWHPAWWGGNLRGVKDYPIDLGEHQDKLVYSPHDYGPSVYAQTWFDKDFTTQTLLDDYWYDTWAYIDDQGIAPLLIGEWGGFMDAGKNQKWMSLLRDYMIENHINHTFWCINPNSGDTGGLLDATFSKWDEEKYGLMEPSLWQDDNGRYISADHVYPLGSNGQSLTEYYGGTPTPPTTTTKPADTTASGTVTKGDLNKDGKVTIADLLLMSRYLVREIDASKIPSTAACDVNGDGRVNAVDCVLVKQFLAHLIDKFPA
nr:MULTISPECIES: cellulase family glycosylhydrolase [Ruminococcus]